MKPPTKKEAEAFIRLAELEAGPNCLDLWFRRCVAALRSVAA